MNGDANYVVFDSWNFDAPAEQSLVTRALQPTAEHAVLSYDVVEFTLAAAYLSKGVELYVEVSTDGAVAADQVLILDESSVPVTGVTASVTRYPDTNTGSRQANKYAAEAGETKILY